MQDLIENMQKLFYQFFCTMIDEFTNYQIEWLISHNDLELYPEDEELIICFLKDTAKCFKYEVNKYGRI